MIRKTIGYNGVHYFQTNPISPEETKASCWLGSQISENVHGSEDLGIFDGALSRGGAAGESHFHLLANAAEPWR